MVGSSYYYANLNKSRLQQLLYVSDVTITCSSEVPLKDGNVRHWHLNLIYTVGDPFRTHWALIIYIFQLKLNLILNLRIFVQCKIELDCGDAMSKPVPPSVTQLPRPVG